jgi:hypothetical protein
MISPTRTSQLPDPNASGYPAIFAHAENNIACNNNEIKAECEIGRKTR